MKKIERKKSEEFILVFTNKDQVKILIPKLSFNANSKSESKYTGYFRYNWKIT